LDSEDIAVLELSEEESNALRFKFLQIDGSPNVNIEDFLKKAREVVGGFERVVAAVEKFNSDRQKVGLLIRNMPVDEGLPLTNNVPRFYTIVKDTSLSEAGVLGIGSYIGELFSYSGDEASLIESLFPIEEEAYRRSGACSKIMLPFHIDRAYHQICPLVISLCCLRGDPAAGTFVSNLDKVLKLLDSSDIETLRQPLFTNFSNSSFGPKQELRKKVKNVSILRGDYDEPHVFLSGPCEPENHEAAQALERFKQAAEEVHVKVYLEAGDILFIKNTRSVHARSTYSPKFDGNDRLLQITQLRKDLWDHIPFPARIVENAPEYVVA